jgi:hypothetical protein
MQIKSTAAISAKWTRVTPQRQQDYTDGVAAPRRSWSQATAEAEPAYIAGVQASLTRKSWSKGVARAGDARWKARATSVGPSRWAEGVSQAGDSYAKGFAPYAQTLSALTLPARGAKGDPKNISRVAAVANAMHATKLSLSS